MRYLGIDYGLSRVGYAISDDQGLLARPLETLHRHKKTKDGRVRETLGLKRVGDYSLDLVSQHGVECVVLGLPYRSPDQRVQSLRALRASPRISPVLQQIFQLGDYLSPSCPVLYFDEAYTTVRAYEKMRDLGTKAKKKQGLVDQMAAQLMLEDFLYAKGASSGLILEEDL